MTTSPDPDQIRRTLNTEVERIRSRSELTPQARRQLIARAASSARVQMDAAQQAEQAAAAAMTRQLTTKAFGVSDLGDPAQLAVSTRDAADRAAMASTPEEAQRLLDQAQVSGDEVLARAVGARVHQLALAPAGAAWEAPLASYVADRPVQGAAVNELRESAMPAATTLFRYAMVAPSEISGLTDHQVDQVAEGPEGLAG